MVNNATRSALLPAGRVSSRRWATACQDHVVRKCAKIGLLVRYDCLLSRYTFQRFAARQLFQPQRRDLPVCIAAGSPKQVNLPIKPNQKRLAKLGLLQRIICGSS